ncbi:TonB-dependent receptor, partial [Arsukibacterium sp.]|uniref:TonB-dependent receptor n=1 Tax=Arsukibacterium sp. TaxID=1977258 RepID=UPI00356A2627
FEQNDYSAGNPDFDNSGHRFSVNFVDKFLDDTVGVALVVSSMETPRQEQQFRGWGYAGVNLSLDDNGDFNNARRDTDTVDVPAGTVVLGGHDSFTRSAMLERDSFAAIVEYTPTDKLTLKFDALYVDFTENDVRRGLEEGGAEWGTGDYTITGVENGLVTSGYYDGFHSVVRNDARSQEADLFTFGLNLEYELSDDWTAQLDMSSGKVDKTITDVESYSGVGRAGTPGRPLAARSWTMTPTGVIYSDHPTLPSVDYTDASLMRLAGPQGWGGALGAIPQFDGTTNAQDGFVNQPVFEETLDSLRLQFNGFVSWGIITGVETGIAYQERSKTKINNGAFLTAPSWPDDVAIPNPLGVADLSFIGIAGVTAYDSLGLYNSGYYIETDAALLENGRFGDTYKIDEELTTLFAKFDVNTEVAGMMVQGNFGLQVVNAKQSGEGFSTTSNAQGFTVATPVSDSDDYTDILPTLNVSVEVADRQYVRTALSKVISRPRMDDMRPNAQVTFQFNDSNILSDDPQNSPWGGNSGNTRLKPLEANQFDLAYENYYHDNGFFAASFFFKDLKNWHRNETVIADFSDVYIPGYHQSSNETGNRPPELFVGNISQVTDGLQGFVRGYEFQASVPFEIVHEALDGFGVVASATFMDGKLDDGARVPGLSEETYTLTAYYEYKGFEFRVSGTKRDEFLTETRGLSLSRVECVDRGAELWDAQLGYDFSESGIDGLDGLRLTFQVQNITDEPTLRTNGADARQVTDYQSFGRNFMLGLNYKF